MSTGKLCCETTSQFIGWQSPCSQQLVDCGILIEEAKLLLFARHGAKKSMCAMDLAFSVATGGQWLGFKCNPASVMVINVEISKAAYQARVTKYLANNGMVAPDNIYWITEPNFKIHPAEDYRALEAEVKLHRPKVLIIDPIYKVVRGNISNNQDVEVVTDLLDGLAARYGVAIVMIGHTRKVNYNVPVAEIDWGQELIGSSFFMNWADTGIAIVPTGPDEGGLHFVKTRNSEDYLEPIKAVFNRHTLRWEVVP